MIRHLYRKHRKQIKKATATTLTILSLFFLITLFHANPASGQTVTVGNVVASAGQQVNVPVSFSGMTNINSFEFYFFFDSNVITPNDPAMVNLPSNYASAVSVIPGDYFIYVNFFVQSPVNIPDGKLFDLSFTYNGGSTAITFTDEVFQNYTEIPITKVEGSVSDGTVTSYSLNLQTTGQGSVTVNGSPYNPGMTFPSGTTVQLNAIHESGWAFNSWSDDLTGATNPVNIIMNSDKFITANFVEVTAPTQYTLTITTTGNGTVNVNGTPYNGPRLIDANTTVNIQAFPSSGWTFSSWSGGYTDTSSTGSFTMTGDRSITANFVESTTPTQYTLTINFSGNGQVLVNGANYNSPRTFNANDVVSLQALASAGWSFSSWSGSLSGSVNPTTILMNSNKTILATFTQAPPPSQYTLTINTAGNGTVNVNGTPYTGALTLPANTTVNLQALAAQGWSFSSWSGSLSGSDNPASLLMNSNKAITATFTESVTPQQYTLTVGITGNGEVRVNGTPYTAPVTVNAGTVLSLTHHTAEGWQFTGWGGSIAGTGSPIEIAMNANKDVTATFTQIPQTKYTLTADMIGGGSLLVNGHTYTVPIGYTEVSFPTLNAIPDPGWKFVGWGGNMSGNSNPTTLIINTNKYITATFEELPNTPYTLSIDITGEGVIRVNGQVYTEPMTIIVGTEVTIEASAMGGWLFTGYGGDIIYAGNILQFIMESDRSLTAGFVTSHLLNVMANPNNIGATVTGSGQYGAGQPATITAQTPDGFLFDRWSGSASNLALLDDPSSPDQTFTMPARNVTFTAHFSIIMPQLYSLNLSADPANIGAALSGGGDYAQGSTVNIAAGDVTGYTFTGWTGTAADVALLGNASVASTSLTMPGRNVVLTASYEPVVITKHTLTLNLQPGNAGANLFGAGAYEEGTSVTITAGAATGYLFTGWSGAAADIALLGNASAATTTLTMPARQVGLTANYEPIPPQKYTLTLIADPDGLGAVLTGGGEYEAGEQVSISAATVSGYSFTGWSGAAADVALLGNASAASTSLTMPNRALSLNANYEEIPPVEFTLTVNITGSGSVQVNGMPYETPVTFEEGSDVNLSALAANNWQFAGWSGDLTGNSQQGTLTMNANKQVTANFTEIPPTEFDITFMVFDNEENPIQNAIVIFNGNASPPGQYTFQNMTAGTYTFVIIASGYLNASGSISLINADVTVPVTLVKSTVSAEEAKAAEAIRVYPNPASQRVHVEASEPINEVRIISLLGHVMHTTTGNGDRNLEIPLINLDAGVYFIQILTTGKLFTSRISVY